MRQVRATILALLPLAALMPSGTARATDLSGTYTSTEVITTDSRLTGDVTCNITVPGPGPCIQFGAPGIQLDLNGHTITGDNGGASSNANLKVCSGSVPTDSAIDTNGKDNAEIIGPGLITNFRGTGIIVTGNQSQVHHVVLISICLNGINVAGSQNQIRSNSISRFSLAASGYFGISVGGTGSHNIVGNDITGGGPLILTAFQACGSTNPADGCDSLTTEANGIGVSSEGNEIQKNNASGLETGFFMKVTTATGNNIHDNQFIGNATDVFDDSGGPNTYTSNVCQYGPPVVCPSFPADVIGRR
jgi:hypothetical protein